MHRLRRRRQDDHRRLAGAASRRARAPYRRAHDRPGQAAGAVDGPVRAGQHPPPRRGRRPGPRRLARRDDARHEADLRRDRPDPRRGRQGDPDPGEPLLPGAFQLLRRHAGVHGDGEARPAQGHRRLRPDRRGHPSDALGPGLPRRPGAAHDVPRRAHGPHPARPREGRRQGLPQGRQHRVQPLHQRHHQDHRCAGAPGRVAVHRRARDDVRRVPRAGADHLRPAQGPRHRLRRRRRT